MKKLISICIFFGTYISVFSQAIVDQPLKFNVPVEAQEFFIYHTMSSSSSQVPAQMVNGYFDNTPGIPTNEFIELGNTFTSNFNNAEVSGGRSMNAIAINHDGDSYDNVAAVHESAVGFRVMWPSINKNNLGLSDDEFIYIDTKSEFGVDQPTIKLAKADFDGDRKEELVIAYRKYDTEKIMIEVRRFGPSSTGFIAAADFAPLTGQLEHYEAFDITADDFDGDGTPEIALYSIVNDGGQRKQRIGIYHAEPGAQPWEWELSAKGNIIFDAVNTSNNGWENLAITSGYFNLEMAPQKQMAAVINYKDGASGNTIEKIFIASTDDLENITVHQAGEYSTSYFSSGPVAISLDCGDLNNDDSEEIIRAKNAEFQIFDTDVNNTIIPKAQGGSGNVDGDFYLLARNGSYLTIGDADMDGVNDILIVTSSNDGDYVKFSMNVSTANQNLNTLTIKGDEGSF